MNDTRNFSKFNSTEPFDRKIHLSEDMSGMISPFKNKKPFSKMLQSCDVKPAQDVIKDLNSSQRQESKKMTLQKVLMRLNVASK